MSSSLLKIPFSIPAGQSLPLDVIADFFRLDTFPTGLLLGVNGALPKSFPEGLVYNGVVRRLQIENTSGGTLTGELSHGIGNISLPGVTVISGSVPLPTGASTAALQTAGNASLASVDGKLPALSGGKVPVTDPTALPLPSGAATGAKQDTGNAYLATLANPTARSTRFVNFTGGGGSLVIAAGARSLDILNTHTSIALTVQVTGQAAATLAAGQGVGFPLLHPRDTGHEEVTISGASGATANVTYIL